MNFPSIKNLLISRSAIWLLVLWQAATVYLMAVGALPEKTAVLSTALLAGYVFLAGPLNGLLLLVLSIPFYVVVPNQYLDALPMWRPLFVVLLLSWLYELIKHQTDKIDWKVLVNAIRSRLTRFPVAWHRWLVLLMVFASLSLFIARFPVHGFKQILFLLNIGMLYVVAFGVAKNYDDFKLILRYTTYSLGMLVGLGFVQFVASLFSDQFLLWQFWATFVSKLYYGSGLAQVLSYSNSWFSAGSGGSLRMFGVLPDTHAFAVVAMFLLMYLVAQVRVEGDKHGTKVALNKQHPIFWPSIVLTAFAFVSSGTRGAWVAIIPAALLALGVWLWRPMRQLIKMQLVVYGTIVLLFVCSPLISQGLNLVRSGMQGDNILARAKSIYDLEETSNIGRLKIWKDSAIFAATHPLGTGYGNFIVSVVKEIPPGSSFEQVSATKNFLYNLPQKFVTAHSLYLHMLVELGIVGLLIFLGIWLSYFKSLGEYFTANQSRLDLQTLFLAASGSVVLWLLAYGVFDLTMFNDRVLQYLALTLALSGAIVSGRTTSSDKS